MVDIQVRELAPDELDAAVELVARAMLDNPLHVKALGDDPSRRDTGVRKLQRALIQSVRMRGFVLVAVWDGALVGVCGIARRKSRFAESIDLVRAAFSGISPGVMLRQTRWFLQWAQRQPPEPYWHLGPVAVDVHVQGRGIGTALMDAICSLADEAGSLTYLETDKPANVKFYRKFAFETVDRADVIGVQNWFMMRPTKLSVVR